MRRKSDAQRASMLIVKRLLASLLTALVAATIVLGPRRARLGSDTGPQVFSALLALPAPQVQPRYEFRAKHDPNGTGKFYMGREIARVMGYEGISWLDRTERVEEEKPEIVVGAMG